MLNLRVLIHNKRRSFLEENFMNDYDFEIQQLIGNLDQVTISLEARWGVMRLPEIVSPAMKEKWDRHFGKLCDAITKNNLVELRELVPGALRAYDAMEADARRLGQPSYDPVFWEVRLPDKDRTIRVVKNNVDASICAMDGVEVWTLEEIARVVSAQQLDAVAEVKQLFPGSTVTSFEEDSLPW